MTTSFDPYLQWLGIRDPQRPPNHYRLLGIDLFEADADVIATAADRQMSHVRTYQSGAHGELSQRLLNELSAARLCLLKPGRKTEYDNHLRQLLRARTATPAAVPFAPPAVLPSPLAPLAVVAGTAGAAVDAEGVATAAAPKAEVIHDDLVLANGDNLFGKIHTARKGRRIAEKWLSQILLLAAAVALAAFVGVMAWRNDRFSAKVAKAPTAATASPNAAKSSSISPAEHKFPRADDKLKSLNDTAVPKVAPSSKPSIADHTDRPEIAPPIALPKPPGNSKGPDPDDKITASPSGKTAKGISAADKTTIADLLTETVDADAMEVETADPDGKMSDEQELELVDELVDDTQAPAATERIAVPTPPQIATAETRIRDAFAGDFSAAKTPSAKSDLALLLTQKASESNDDPPAQFAMLVMAQDLALSANRPDRIFEAIDRRGERFEVDEIDEKTWALFQLEKAVKSREAREELLFWVEGLIAQALERQRYDCAEKLTALQVRSLRGARDKELLKSAAFREKEVKELSKLFAAAESARQQLVTDADDPDANLKLGTYLCFIRNDWTNGAVHLAKCGDAALQAIAQQELTRPTEPKARLALAELWYQYADSKQTFANEARRRARDLFALSVDDLHGLDKAEAEKRLATLTDELAGTVAANLVVIELPAGVKLPMRQVPAGKFTMGSPDNELGRDPDEQAHEVLISKSYLLGASEVTQGQWNSVMGRNPGQPQAASLPVNNVSWQDAVNFCDQLNKTSVGVKYRFRLPTEAEWEYACRAGTRTPFYWGSSPTQLDQFAWTRQKSGGVLRPVARLRPNPLGFYDMLGNVAEWTADWRSPLTKVSQRDPQGPEEGFRKLHRGGHVLLYMPKSFRSAARDGSPPGEVRQYIGFRVAAEIL